MDFAKDALLEACQLSSQCVHAHAQGSRRRPSHAMTLPCTTHCFGSSSCGRALPPPPLSRWDCTLTPTAALHARWPARAPAPCHAFAAHRWLLPTPPSPCAAQGCCWSWPSQALAPEKGGCCTAKARRHADAIGYRQRRDRCMEGSHTVTTGHLPTPSNANAMRPSLSRPLQSMQRSARKACSARCVLLHAYRCVSYVQAPHSMPLGGREVHARRVQH